MWPFLSDFSQYVKHTVFKGHQHSVYRYVMICLSIVYWWHLGCFHLLDAVNSAAVSMHVHVLIWVSAFNSSGRSLEEDSIELHCFSKVYFSIMWTEDPQEALYK
jgi:hypothetical protein